MFKATRIRFRVLACLRHALSAKQKSEIKHICRGIQAHIPQPTWRELSTEYLAALHIWHIVEAGIVDLDALNLMGLDAWKSANDQIHRAARRGRTREIRCESPEKRGSTMTFPLDALHEPGSKTRGTP